MSKSQGKFQLMSDSNLVIAPQMGISRPSLSSQCWEVLPGFCDKPQYMFHIQLLHKEFVQRCLGNSVG